MSTSLPKLPELIGGLSRPAAWPGAPVRAEVARVEFVQTHISAVFLAGDRVLKIKKPVNLGFLDFSTRALRLSACEAEVRLNRRLAPDVYLGVVAVVSDAQGGLQIKERPPAGDDEEPGVLMRRLPAERSLAGMLESGTLAGAILARVGRRLAEFHAIAEAGPEVQAASRWEPLAAVVRANLAQCEPFAGRTITPELLAALRSETERELARVRPVVESRAARGMGRDGHGDLRLDHVYVLDAAPPGDVIAVDCIEFRDDFRRGDPVGDVAFLAMELQFAGRDDLARVLVDAWIEARRDDEARELLPLNLAYRNAVRGKVRSIESLEPEVPAAARANAAERATAHFLAAFVAVAAPSRRPALVLTCGLPGSGKSTVARGLEREAAFVRVSSDETRKALAMCEPSPIPGMELYSPDWTERTYAACLQECERLLLQGRRVVADASFHDAARRATFLNIARRLHVPVLVVECIASDDEARERLARRVGDASDADDVVRGAMSQRWEAPDEDERARWRRLESGPAPEADIASAIALLRRDGFA